MLKKRPTTATTPFCPSEVAGTVTEHCSLWCLFVLISAANAWMVWQALSD